MRVVSVVRKLGLKRWVLSLSRWVLPSSKRGDGERRGVDDGQAEGCTETRAWGGGELTERVGSHDDAVLVAHCDDGGARDGWA